MADDTKNTPGTLRASAVAERKTRSAWWVWLQSLFLVAGIILVSFYGAARVDRLLHSRQLLDRFATPNSAAIRTEESAARITPSITSDPAETPAQTLGALSIPKIYLKAPILDGTDALTLNHAIGRIEGTARLGEQQGNIGLAGHRDGFFRNLGKLRAGDVLELETKLGTDKYFVDEIRIVQPQDVWVLAPRALPSLTLVTCYPFHGLGHAPERYVVTASLAQKTEGPPQTSRSAPAH